MTASEQPKAIAMFDGDCKLCTWGIVGLATSCDGQVALSKIQDPQSQEILAKFGVADSDRLSSWHTYDGERLLHQVDALEIVFPHMKPSLFKYASLVLLKLPRPLANRFYEWIANNRVALSKFVPAQAKAKACRALPMFTWNPDRTGKPDSF